MPFVPCTHWTTWLWMLFVGTIQIYLIYSSILRYINLKFEVLGGFFIDYEDFQWILTLLNFQLSVIIGSLAILPIWVYSVLSLSSSFFCEKNITVDKRGFYQLVWDEALRILNRHINDDFSHLDNIKKNCCKRDVKLVKFFPVSCLLHVLMAYLLFSPIPFTEAWLIYSHDVQRETVWFNDLEFLGSNSFIVKIKCSVEYFNLFLSLFILSFQLSKLLWSCNRSFAILLNIIEILITIHVLINFSLFSIFIKYYYKYLKDTQRLLHPSFILLITCLSDILLILTSFSYFQFGFEKCVQSLLRSAWFNHFNRLKTNTITNSNCQSINNSPTFYLSGNVIDTKNNFCPTISAAVLFILGMSMKTFASYDYWLHLRDSRYFTVYLVESLILIVAYFMIWFGMCLKPDWIFRITDKQLRQYSIITCTDKVQSNEYKSLGSHVNNSLTSLSPSSNINIKPKLRNTLPRSDFTNHTEYNLQCSSLQLPSNKLLSGSAEYLQLSNKLYQSNDSKSTYASNSSTEITSPTMYKEFIRSLTPSYYKCSNPSYSILKSNEAIKQDELEELKKSSNSSYPIEGRNKNIDETSSEEEVFVDAIQSTSKNNNSQLKFVTFQLDKNAEISADMCSSNDSLTIVSLEVPETFMGEKEENEKAFCYTTFKGETKCDVSLNPFFATRNVNLDL